jgi:hypothetical protein
VRWCCGAAAGAVVRLARPDILLSFDCLLPHFLPAQQSDKAFISAVCWRPGAQTLLAANSMGTVKVFSLTGSSSQLL